MADEAPSDDVKLGKLRRFNLVMGLFHLIQGIAMLALSNDFSLPVTRGFLEFDPSTSTLSPASATVFELPIGPVVASFLFMSAAAHLLIAGTPTA
jgi:hypothetical protein